MVSKGKAEAVAYMRTSSATNVGADKDSEKRQRAAIAAYAKRAGVEVAADGWFYDAGVPGTVPVVARPAFADLLARIDANGVRMVLVEDASRFAREMVTQELGIAEMARRGVEVVACNGDHLTDAGDEMRVMVRQILGAVAQNEKTRPREETQSRAGPQSRRARVPR